MTNGEKFKSEFGIYATELWAMSEDDFLKWLKAKAEPKHGVIELTYEEYGELCSYALADEQKHGRWINDKGLYKCSVCNNFTITGWDIPIEQMNKTMKYCNNCGAKMDEVEE